MSALNQVGTCVVFAALSGQPAAKCLECRWEGVAIYDYDLARQVAEHSRSHAIPQRYNDRDRKAG